MQGDLFYSENLSEMDNQYLVFELPDELLSELEYKSLHIGGEPNQDAIISGSKSSYLIKKCETSNTMLISSENMILKSSKFVLKCEKIIPPLHQVLALLSESPYTYLDQSKF